MDSQDESEELPTDNEIRAIKLLEEVYKEIEYIPV
jgi:hypothetical protein